jgi:hypothetical protein
MAAGLLLVGIAACLILILLARLLLLLLFFSGQPWHGSPASPIHTMIVLGSGEQLLCIST